ncbi:MAG: preprotein translocase subunit SecE [Planctomycetaceae bacterium]|nr:preprotein translocase subunit SecE [Planctomycetaceae bacterium]MBT6153933.1 preprotein translocase subunit SecE [Planctomycetaceae bacterium]MBT6483765.1 preprotein translocase subunit SecE [Planctomycetaceae bacterium]MBT6494539.1 preprotein translocase subunit SecE [Planctomycetaceae bacterium]
MKVSAAGFASDIESQYGAGVRVSQPRGQSRRAVGISIGIPVLLCAIGLWLVFRAVNFPRFADFLISVEAEMDKVSWPGRPELYRSTAVVVSTMFLLGFMLLAYDVFWKFFFELVGFLRIASS